MPFVLMLWSGVAPKYHKWSPRMPKWRQQASQMTALGNHRCSKRGPAQLGQPANQYGRAKDGRTVRARGQRGAQSGVSPLSIVASKSSQQLAASKQPVTKNTKQPTPAQPASPSTAEFSASGCARVGGNAPHINIIMSGQAFLEIIN